MKSTRKPDLIIEGEYTRQEYWLEDIDMEVMKYPDLNDRKLSEKLKQPINKVRHSVRKLQELGLY